MRLAHCQWAHQLGGIDTSKSPSVYSMLLMLHISHRHVRPGLDTRKGGVNHEYTVF